MRVFCHIALIALTLAAATVSAFAHIPRNAIPSSIRVYSCKFVDQSAHFPTSVYSVPSVVKNPPSYGWLAELDATGQRVCDYISDGQSDVPAMPFVSELNAFFENRRGFMCATLP